MSSADLPTSRAPRIEASFRRALIARETGASRLVFVDIARGLIVLLMIATAMISATMRGGGDSPFSSILAFTASFAAPTFFLLAGVFLHRFNHLPWSDYFVRKLAPLIWRYILWGSAGVVLALWPWTPVKPGLLLSGLGRLFFNPPAMLLILIVLAISLALVRLLRGLPVVLTLPVIAGLEVANVNYGGPIPASVSQLLIYLYLGNAFAPEIRQFARYATRSKKQVACGLVVWALLNGVATLAPLPLAGAPNLAHLPFASLGLGVFGAAAIVALASLITDSSEASILRWIGERGLGVYLVSFILIGPLQIVSLKTPLYSILAFGVCGLGLSLVAFAMARRTAPQ